MLAHLRIKGFYPLKNPTKGRSPLPRGRSPLGNPLQALCACKIKFQGAWPLEKPHQRTQSFGNLNLKNMSLWKPKLKKHVPFGNPTYLSCLPWPDSSKSLAIRTFNANKSGALRNRSLGIATLYSPMILAGSPANKNTRSDK